AGHREVVISEALWRDQFGASPNVVGQSLLLNGTTFTIAGVVEGFRGWSFVFRTDLWLPMAEWPAIDARTGPADLWSGGFSQFFGRRRSGMTPEAVEPRLAAIFDHVDEARPTPRRVPLAPTASRGLSVISQGSLEARVRAVFRVVST